MERTPSTSWLVLSNSTSTRNGYELGYGTNQKNGERKDEKTRATTAYAYHTSLVSYFGRLNYILQDKYLLTATIRRDGTSRFAPNCRWGTFPSVALGWKVKEEAFLKDVNALSDLKLRVSWGLTASKLSPQVTSPTCPNTLSTKTEHTTSLATTSTTPPVLRPTTAN